MNKIKGYVKRTLCVILTSFVLMTTLVDSYIGATPCYAGELAAYGLFDAMSALMASMGYSMNVSGDRQAAAQQVYNSIVKTFEGQEGDANQKYRDAFDKILTGAYVSGKLVFDKEVEAAQGVWAAIKSWGQGLFKKTKPVDQCTLNNMDIHLVSGSLTGSLIDSNYSFRSTNGTEVAKLAAGYKYWVFFVTSDNFFLYYGNNVRLVSNYGNYSNGDWVNCIDFNWCLNTTNSCVHVDGGYARCINNDNLKSESGICGFIAQSLLLNDTGRLYTNIPVKGLDGLGAGTSVSDQLALGSDASVDISDELSSVADAGHDYDVITPTNTYDAVTGAIGGTTTIPIDGTVTQKVKAVDRTAGTVAGSDQAIADALADLAAAQDDMSDALDDNTSILKQILDTISKSVVLPIGQIVDGTSALKEDADSISDQFEVVDGGKQQDPDDNNDPKWTPFALPMPKFLANFANWLTTPLQKIITTLGLIYGSIVNLPQILTEHGLSLGNIVTSLSTIVLTVGGVKTLLENLPGDIGEIIEMPDLSSIIEILPDIQGAIVDLPDRLAEIFEFPEIKFPEIPNYKSLLEQMLEFLRNLGKLGNIESLLSSIFVLDIAAVSAAFSDAFDVWNFDFLNDLKALFTDLDFGAVKYPKIEIKRPKVFAQFYEPETIVLCDFANYKSQLAWCRNIVRLICYVYLAYALFKHFHIDFSLS